MIDIYNRRRDTIRSAVEHRYFLPGDLVLLVLGDWLLFVLTESVLESTGGHIAMSSGCIESSIHNATELSQNFESLDLVNIIIHHERCWTLITVGALFLWWRKRKAKPSQQEKNK
jgi:hypothetical protein